MKSDYMELDGSTSSEDVNEDIHDEMAELNSDDVSIRDELADVEYSKKETNERFRDDLEYSGSSRSRERKKMESRTLAKMKDQCFFHLDPTDADVAAQKRFEKAQKRKQENQNNGGNHLNDYDIVSIPEDIANSINNNSAENHRRSRPSTPDVDRRNNFTYAESSDSTLFEISEASEDRDTTKSIKNSTKGIIYRILQIDFFYFLFATILVLFLSLFIHKDFEWTFFYVKDWNVDPKVHEEYRVNGRKIGVSLAFFIFIVGITSFVLELAIRFIESAFDLRDEFWTVVSYLNVHIAFSIIILVLLSIVLYYGMLGVQFAKDTKLDFGHVLGVLLFTDVLLILKSYFFKSVELSFDHMRYMKRVKGILKDHFFLVLLKTIKKKKTENSNLSDREIKQSVPVEEFSHENMNVSQKSKAASLLNARRNQLNSAHNRNCPNLSDPKAMPMAKKVARKHIGPGIFTMINNPYYFNSEMKMTRTELALLKSAFYKLTPRDIASSSTKLKWRNRAEELISRFDHVPLKDLAEHFCCEKFFFLWLDSMKLTNLEKSHEENYDEYDSSSSCEFDRVSGEKRDKFGHSRKFSGSSQKQEYDPELGMKQPDDSNSDESEPQPDLRSSDLNEPIPGDSVLPRPDYSTSKSNKSVKTARTSLHAREKNGKIKKGKDMSEELLTFGLIYKIYERRDRELFNLSKSLQQNNAAVQRVANFLSVIIYLLALSIFLAISLNKTDSTVDFLSAIFGTGFILHSVIKDAINSCVFVFCIQPFDIGDRVMISLDNHVENLVVHELNVLSTTFIKFDGLYIIVPNTTLSAKSIMNIRRSPLLAESFYINIRHDTSLELLNTLRYNIGNFLKSHPALFTEYFYFNYHVIEDCNKLTLRIYIQYVENWQDYERYLERRGMFLAYLNKCLTELKISYVPLVQPIILRKE